MEPEPRADPHINGPVLWEAGEFLREAGGGGCGWVSWGGQGWLLAALLPRRRPDEREQGEHPSGVLRARFAQSPLSLTARGLLR